jgi:hypothetical protein
MMAACFVGIPAPAIATDAVNSPIVENTYALLGNNETHTAAAFKTEMPYRWSALIVYNKPPLHTFLEFVLF